MTLERAAEIISAVRKEYAEDNRKVELFRYFVSVFDLDNKWTLIFAKMCGFNEAPKIELDKWTNQ